MDSREGEQARGWSFIFASWLVACVSTLASLFLSDVMHVVPCVLCWYQRICMYPLVLLLPVGMFAPDRNLIRYTLPLASLGLGLAVFHLLVVAGYVPESMQPCTQGVPCSEVQVQWFGFVTVPLLSALSFLLIIVLLLVGHRRNAQ